MQLEKRRFIIAMVAFYIITALPTLGYCLPLDDLATKLRQISADTPGNSVVGISVIDVVSGDVIYEKNADKLLNPASNAKVITAAAALKILGPEHRFVTQLYGQINNQRIDGAVYIKGHGDPSLTTADLWQMVMELKADGVRRVGGGVVVDDSFFDGNNLPYAYDQQPNEDNKFRAPVGAVSVNYNAIGVQIRPASMAMNKALVTMDPPGYAVVVNDTLTVGQGAYSPKISASEYEDRTRIRVWGNVPLSSSPQLFFRRVDNPSLFSGYALKAVLEEAGISVRGNVRTGKVPHGTKLITVHSSKPLSSVLWHTGKMSNNFVTEMVLKNIGANTGKGPATWEQSTAAVAAELEKWGIAQGSYEYRNGSGLFDANKVSARQLCQVLRAVYNDAGIRPEMLAQLATGGVDGTIAGRYRSSVAKRYVRAKTGTLDAVSALSGYVLDEKGHRPVTFSILVNNASGYVAAARNYQESIVTAIARALNE